MPEIHKLRQEQPAQFEAELKHRKALLWISSVLFLVSEFCMGGPVFLLTLLRYGQSAIPPRKLGASSTSLQRAYAESDTRYWVLLGTSVLGTLVWLLVIGALITVLVGNSTRTAKRIAALILLAIVAFFFFELLTTKKTVVVF